MRWVVSWGGEREREGIIECERASPSPSNVKALKYYVVRRLIFGVDLTPELVSKTLH